MAELTEKERKQLERNKKWWADRTAETQAELTKRGAVRANAQLQKYYTNSMQKIIGHFEKTYNKVFSRIEEGKAPTPADLYKLDTYWQMQGQIRQELERLGNKQAALFGNAFEKLFFDVYNSLALEGETAFSTIDTEVVQQMISQIWCADGKTWSSRIWANTELLQQTLNDSLLDCLVAGRKTTELKNLLQERFGVSYHNAETIVRTEMAHIQTQAAKKRYEDYGIQQVEILADEDERRCPICAKLNGKRFFVGEAVPIPAHPRCRCCVVPVVD